MNPTLPTRANSAILEQTYSQWLDNPDSVDPTWRAFFQGFTLGTTGSPIGAAPASDIKIIDSYKQAQVGRFINAHRSHGHLEAHLDPLGDAPPPHPKLALASFGLTDDDLDEAFTLTNFKGGGQMRLRDIVEAVKDTYCSNVGVEYMHVQDHAAREWLQVRMEATNNNPAFTNAQKRRILSRIHKAELFEKFLHTKYVGQKRFSLEGGETLIAALDAMIEHAPDVGVEEFVLGMAHRGRLSVLANTLRKPFDVLFEQFSENYIPHTVAGDGDVKYHLGYEAALETTTGKTIEVRLAANPSHLEIVNPVVEGKTRARQRIRGDATERRRVCPLLIHGDAAFAGQGVVAETLNFSQLPGYRTGGTLHFVINNQIGFTTLPSDARSTRYCTDVAKMIEAPIFHVNGDDPEAVCMVARLALEFRIKFQRDIVIDMYCYRRHGHNEADEPAFTQPTLYKQIAQHPLVSTIYTQRLAAEGSLTQADSDAIKAQYTAAMDAAFEKAKLADIERAAAGERGDQFRGSTAVFQPAYSHAPVSTGISNESIDTLVRGLTHLPPGFHPNPKIRRFLDARLRAREEGGPVDWAYAEALAFGSLLLEGIPVRLSGQDCERGTFSHRHAVLYDYENREKYIPLRHLAANVVTTVPFTASGIAPADTTAKFCVYNSLLSEAAVLGFDYGYSLDYPQMLCIWEAQFGDFANGAQVVIDQFISSAESKWQRASGIVLLLPHGYEGQGSEHSSARLERFLQLCAEDNIQVANITTPANYFHALRRQMKRDFRKPLVVMSPKSLLRNPIAVSMFSDFTEGH
ncbi:2-oxoglutarate dehydrogenase E1 component, partial [Geminisphaera colitermitum]|uniref:2-oxoglutarate dehydrogenase E1 component n=1 Tax=Geminisphaera colitermitum TaxID=1148786 RepID=UPI0005BB129B